MTPRPSRQMPVRSESVRTVSPADQHPSRFRKTFARRRRHLHVRRMFSTFLCRTNRNVCSWEYVTTFGFEWQIITGKRKYRWTILLYSGCRLSALLAVIVIFIGFNVTTEINCKLWLIFVFTTAYSAFVFASALIVLRIIAIWERNKVVSAIAIGAWLTNIAFYIHNIATANSAWSPEQQTCLLLDSHRSEANTIVTLIEDFVLLGLMLLGLRRYGNAGMFGGLWRLLYRQGLLWLIVVTLAEIPPTVFIILNLNDYFNLMFQTPERAFSTAFLPSYRALLTRAYSDHDGRRRLAHLPKPCRLHHHDRVQLGCRAVRLRPPLPRCPC
ncbi:hypothetical protein BC834DRAFT_867755 [Gloeopeniophorella convolvens]|nr:hypothetical protein BC834DRAFT_867755 [Gloeopeniophorella convolvens]